MLSPLGGFGDSCSVVDQVRSMRPGVFEEGSRKKGVRHPSRKLGILHAGRSLPRSPGTKMPSVPKTSTSIHPPPPHGKHHQLLCPSSTLNSPFFFRSIAHFSHHPFILSLLFELPTFTVGITLSIRNAQQNIVSSLKLLCSL